MLPVAEAQNIILEAVTPLPEETAALETALGQILAEPLISKFPLPPFDNSAMDGFAVIAADTAGAGPNNPRSLQISEDLPAGVAPQRKVLSGSAAQIMTGAPLPQGADAIVPVEETRPGEAGEILFLQEAKAGAHIRPAGEDFPAGATVLSPGQELGPGELGLAASLGLTRIKVIRRPRVAIITTGSEIIPPGKPLRPGSIYDSNSILLAGLVKAAGGEVACACRIEDTEAAVTAALKECASADIILTTGGVSVGKYDFVKSALEKLGKIIFWQVAMKPGKPVVFGKILNHPVFGLPGNPVSVLVTFAVFVLPALRKMAGRKDYLPPPILAALENPVTHKPSRREYVQGFAFVRDGELRVQASAKRGSGMLGATAGANCLLVIPEESSNLAAGAKVEIILLRPWGSA
jgi:molybdopterin molybdotransferase